MPPVPAGQGMHSLSSREAWVPSAQATQADLEALGKVPSVQGAQTPGTKGLPASPSAQGSQAERVGAGVVPAAQKVQTPAVLIAPAGHHSHAV